MVEPLPLDTDDFENQQYGSNNQQNMSLGMDGIDVQLEDHDDIKYPKSASGGSAAEIQSGQTRPEERKSASMLETNPNSALGRF
jgi:hypothetical protein